MKSNAFRITVAAAAISLALGFSACGSSDDEGSEATEAETTTTTTAPADSQAVDVSMVEMAFDVSPTSVKAGDVTFNLSNDGTVPHEMVVIKTDKKAGDLGDSSGEASEEGAVGEAEVAPGETDELSLKLAAGHYALVCNLPGHYAAGMYADFEVK